MDITAICTIDKCIRSINVNPCFRSHIKTKIIRYFKICRANDQSFNCTFINFLIQWLKHALNISSIQWRNVLRRQILKYTAPDQIFQSFFRKDSHIILFDLTQNWKMIFHKLIHLLIWHIITIQVFLYYIFCNIPPRTWLWHNHL